MQKYPHLFSPMQIGKHTYKNRMLCSPMGFGFLALLNKESAEALYRHTEEKAKGGVAEVVIGETPVNSSDAPNALFPGTEIDYSKRQGHGLDVYKGYADAIKKYDAIALIEIFHAGQDKTPLPFGEKVNPWGPMALVRDDGVTVEAFDAPKMRKVRDDFVTCSQFMQAAGFDGVCIHGGHGFLFTQFLSALTNRRTDEYGGTFKNRCRFPYEIIRDMRKNLGKDFIIELRINGADREPGGTTNDETAEFCRSLEGLVDIVHVSNGRLYYTMGMSSHYHPHGVNVELAANIKKQINIPVTVVGGINDPDFAEKIIAEGKADFVTLGRQMIADPEFANKARTGHENEIRQCIRCYHCYPGQAEIPGDKGMVPDMRPGQRRGFDGWKCTINPRSSNEVVFDTMPKPQGYRNVLVIGGGPAGMQAAITAADRGHKVTLVEKNSSLGGVLRFTDVDIHKVDLRNFKDLLIREVKHRKIKVLFNTAATPEFVAKFKPDTIILAIGASPARPPIPGIETAIHALDVYKKDTKVGKRVVMVGGGLAGCETALHLAGKGREVTIVEMLTRLVSEARGFALTGTLLEIKKRNINAKTGVKCVEITPDSVKVVDAAGKTEVIQGDTIVYSLGMDARRAEVEKLRTAAGKATVFEAGDCIRGAKVFEATSEGCMAAMKIV